MQNQIINRLIYTRLRPLVRSKNKNNKTYSQAMVGYNLASPERKAQQEIACLFCHLGVTREIMVVSARRGSWLQEEIDTSKDATARADGDEDMIFMVRTP